MAHPDCESMLNDIQSIQEKPETLMKLYFHKFKKNKLAVFGAIVLLIIIFLTILAPWISPYHPAETDVANKLAAPSAAHWLGTDRLGRDILARLLYGGRISLLIAFSSVAGTLVIGTTIGALAGYYGGFLDAVLMRLVDIVLSIPSIFLLITIVTIFEPGMNKLIFILALISWTSTARIVRGEFLALRTKEFVLASRTIGTRSYKIIFSHMLPNAMSPIIVTATLLIGTVILTEAALSYFGLGVQPPTPSWGNMLQDAQNVTVLMKAPWYPAFPGFMIFITVLCFNFVGDGLRDALDPKER
ncbi:peptide/nickel transport system permease protein [Bacillus thermophilus]|uniref:Peptide/nickel transport system permease protein n=1 Tax=Siminovitchia thermophila TaxID=1245522 RepID=A0ABS2R3I2_9BACI|nr:oligopeptide ABC transporter permease [Siminovitchia thermophila]MBM7713940.1 peptide/nickel transport system permease protein [Siminovitchia thermophila]ONK23826.1 peptide ABC transporter permease [Bacillus sp. VT-16-64]